MDSDYQLYLLHLREMAPKTGCQVHAYCLMTNHVHLLLTPEEEDSCGMLMRHVGQRYVQYFNKRYGRTGTLWEGRYHSCIAESARYVLACYRYIEMNPVRAGMVAHPSQYAWSSHNANSGFRQDRLVTPHAEFTALASGAPERGAAYQAMVSASLEDTVLEEIRSATTGGYPLGSESFRQGISVATGRKVEPGRPGRPPKSQ